ncbi:MAG: sulfide-dependent adenosine diphosphate thiazole synthase [Planctomycetota bacterium]
MQQAQRMFHPVSEKDVTRAIVGEFAAQLDDYADSDVVIVGAGPSGLICGRDLAADGYKVLIVERNNYLGGGFWIGGYLMNKVTVRAPAQEQLDELDVPHKRVGEGLYVADGPHACSKLIAAACDAGVKFANITRVEDVVVRAAGRVAGAVINWAPVEALPRQITCADPVCIEARAVVDATGHDAVVASMAAGHGLVEIGRTGPMWIERSEDEIVARSGAVCGGLFAVGMAVATIHGLPRMGPTFGGMLLSGLRGAQRVRAALTPVRGVEANAQTAAGQST